MLDELELLMLTDTHPLSSVAALVLCASGRGTRAILIPANALGSLGEPAEDLLRGRLTAAEATRGMASRPVFSARVWIAVRALETEEDRERLAGVGPDVGASDRERVNESFRRRALAL